LKTLTFRDGALRLLDATGTPNWIQLLFVDAGFTAPISRARPAEMSKLNRGRVDSTNWHYIQGADDPIVAPLALSFSFALMNGAGDPNYQKFRQALNVDMSATWKVGTVTWVTTKGTSQVRSGGASPTSTTTPTFSDSVKRTVNVETLWTDPDAVGNMGYVWKEVYFPPDKQSLTEGNDAVQIKCSGEVYGDVTTHTAFTAGTQS
jgi:hypothetical protein